MLLFVSLLSASVAIAGVQDVSVDCDHGGDLARVMRSLRNEAPGPIVIHVAGQCIGPIEITRNEVVLSGADGGAIRGAVQDGGASVQPIVRVRGARDVRLENLHLSDGVIGLQAVDAALTVDDCEVVGTDVAVDAEDSTLALSWTALRGARNGIFARRARLAMYLGSIRDVSDEGILATDLSQVTLFRTEVSSDGLAVENHSSLVATHATIEGSIYVQSYSRISLSGAAGLLRGDLYASNSEVLLFRLPVQGTVRAREAVSLTVVEADLQDVRLNAASHAEMTSPRIAGDLLVEGFSTGVLSGTSVVRSLVCRSGGDLACAQPAMESVTGCRSCAP